MSPSGFPTLQPAFIFTVNVGEMHQLGTISSGSNLSHLQTPTGTIKSVEGFSPAIDAEIIFGADCLYFDADGKHARVNLKGLAKTKDGVAISFDNSGIVEPNEEVMKIIGGSPDMKTVPFGMNTTIHKFEVGDSRYKDLEHKHFVSNGRFVVSDKGLSVESRVSVVVPSTVMD